MVMVGGHSDTDSAGGTIRAGLRYGKLLLAGDATFLQIAESRTITASDGTMLRGYRIDGSSIRLGGVLRYTVSRSSHPYTSDRHPERTHDTDIDVWLGVGGGYEWVSFQNMPYARPNAIVEFGLSGGRTFADSHSGFDMGFQFGIAPSPAALAPGTDLSVMYVTAYHFGN